MSQCMWPHSNRCSRFLARMKRKCGSAFPPFPFPSFSFCSPQTPPPPGRTELWLVNPLLATTCGEPPHWLRAVRCTYEMQIQRSAGKSLALSAGVSIHPEGKIERERGRGSGSYAEVDWVKFEVRLNQDERRFKVKILHHLILHFCAFCQFSMPNVWKLNLSLKETFQNPSQVSEWLLFQGKKTKNKEKHTSVGNLLWTSFCFGLFTHRGWNPARLGRDKTPQAGPNYSGQIRRRRDKVSTDQRRRKKKHLVIDFQEEIGRFIVKIGEVEYLWAHCGAQMVFLWDAKYGKGKKNHLFMNFISFLWILFNIRSKGGASRSVRCNAMSGKHEKS